MSIIRNETLHAINIEGIDEALPPDVNEDTLPRAIEKIDIPLGYVSLQEQIIPVSFIVYDGIEKLEDPRPGVERIVSQLTFMAAFKAGRPTDDLLVPHEFDPIRKCVKGLARPTPIRQPKQTLSQPELISFDGVDSACSFPINFYSPNTGPYVSAEEAPFRTIRPLDGATMSLRYQQEPLDEEATARLDLPVYRPINPVVKANEDIFTEGEITIVEPRMFMGGFELYEGNVVRAGFLRQNVRATAGRFVVGGTGIVVPLSLGYRI